jgi:hypothetical protein
MFIVFIFTLNREEHSLVVGSGTFFTLYLLRLLLFSELPVLKI